MLLQTNSYVVPREKRNEHARLLRRFRQTLLRLGCDHFEVYEQVGANWSADDSISRFVQILRFVDRKHQLAVQAAERSDPTAQAVIAEFCEMINFPVQQEKGLFAVGYYTSVLPVAPRRDSQGEIASTVDQESDAGIANSPADGEHTAAEYAAGEYTTEAEFTEVPEPVAGTEPVATESAAELPELEIPASEIPSAGDPPAEPVAPEELPADAELPSVAPVETEATPVATEATPAEPPAAVTAEPAAAAFDFGLTEAGLTEGTATEPASTDAGLNDPVLPDATGADATHPPESEPSTTSYPEGPTDLPELGEPVELSELEELTDLPEPAASETTLEAFDDLPAIENLDQVANLEPVHAAATGAAIGAAAGTQLQPSDLPEPVAPADSATGWEPTLSADAPAPLGQAHPPESEPLLEIGPVHGDDPLMESDEIHAPIHDESATHRWVTPAADSENGISTALSHSDTPHTDPVADEELPELLTEEYVPEEYVPESLGEDFDISSLAEHSEPAEAAEHPTPVEPDRRDTPAGGSVESHGSIEGELVVEDEFEGSWKPTNGHSDQTHAEKSDGGHREPADQPHAW